MAEASTRVTSLTDSSLSTGDVTDNFKKFITEADKEVEKFISDHSSNGTLSMSASESLELQRLMADQSIAAQTGTTTLKSLKDSITAAARNI